MKAMKRVLSGLLVVLCLGVMASPVFAADTTTKDKGTAVTSKSKKNMGYVASKEGGKYHLPGCRLAANIKPENKITFKTKAEAEKAGYKPCAVCKP